MCSKWFILPAFLIHAHVEPLLFSSFLLPPPPPPAAPYLNSGFMLASTLKWLM